jgi:hypothetical protein
MTALRATAGGDRGERRAGNQGLITGRENRR